MPPKINVENTLIGRGAYGVVYKIMLGGAPYALKKARENPQNPEHGESELKQEVDILPRLDHENIIKSFPDLAQIYQADLGPGISLVLEYMDSSSLADLLCSGIENQKTVLELARYIAAGMEYLSGERILHRDIKPGNVFRSSHAPPKLGDFATAVYLPQKTDIYTNPEEGTVGTLLYLAPECSPQGKDSGEYSRASEVFALGILLLDMAFSHSSEAPLLMEPFAWLYRSVAEGFRPPLPTDKVFLNNIIQKAWAQDPQARPNITEIKNSLDELLKEENARLTLKSPDSGIVSLSPPLLTESASQLQLINTPSPHDSFGAFIFQKAPESQPSDDCISSASAG